MSFPGEGGGPGGQPGLDSPTTSHQNRMSATVAQNVCQAPAMLISIADGQAGVGGAWCSGLKRSDTMRRRKPRTRGATGTGSSSAANYALAAVAHGDPGRVRARVLYPKLVGGAGEVRQGVSQAVDVVSAMIGA